MFIAITASLNTPNPDACRRIAWWCTPPAGAKPMSASPDTTSSPATSTVPTHRAVVSYIPGRVGLSGVPRPNSPLPGAIAPFEMASTIDTYSGSCPDSISARVAGLGTGLDTFGRSSRPLDCINSCMWRRRIGRSGCSGDNWYCDSSSAYTNATFGPGAVGGSGDCCPELLIL